MNSILTIMLEYHFIRVDVFGENCNMFCEHLIHRVPLFKYHALIISLSQKSNVF